MDALNIRVLNLSLGAAVTEVVRAELAKIARVDLADARAVAPASSGPTLPGSLLIVVTGHPTLRSPEGERKLQPGDCVHFPSGPRGAHQLVNRTSTVARVLLASNLAMPRAAVQVDSGKMLVRWGTRVEEIKCFPLDAEAGFWDRED